MTKGQDKRIMLMPAIISVSLLTIMAPTAVSPALASIQAAFPDVPSTFVKLVLTLPALIMVPMGPLTARWSEKLGKKRILLIGMSLFLVFGLAGGLAAQFWQLIAARILFGVGLGIMAPLSTSLIFDFEPDPNRRSRLMGIQGSANQLGGLIFLSLSGVLANISWRYSFLTYALVIVSILLTAFFLPSQRVEPGKTDAPKSEERLNAKIFVLAFFAMMIMACYFVINTDLAIFMHSEGLGSADKCGFALSVMRVPAIFMGMVLALLMKRLRDWTMPLAALVMAAGYVMIALSHSYAMVFAACLVIGLGGGIVLPPLMLSVPRIVGPAKLTLGVAILTSVSQLGQFISPIYINLFIADGVQSPLRLRFVVAAVTTVVIAFATLLFLQSLPKKINRV